MGAHESQQLQHAHTHTQIDRERESEKRKRERRDERGLKERRGNLGKCIYG
jgi:hypothetical protein